MRVTLLAYMQMNPEYLYDHDWQVKAESEPEWIASAVMRSTRTLDGMHDILNENPMTKCPFCENGKFWEYIENIDVLHDCPHCEGTGELPLIDKRIKESITMKHFTVAGMTDFIFVIEGVSRSLTHQLVRHRTAWFLQQSSRATDPSKQGFVLPKTARENWSAHDEIDYFYTQARKTYKKLRDMGIPREDARFVLPQGTSQRIVMKIDGSNLLHFFKLRLDKHAQWEIRELAERMHAAVMKVCPNLFDRKLEEYWW